MVKENDKSFQMLHFQFSKLIHYWVDVLKIALLLYFVIQFGKGF
jgi:hypothetical protein